VDPLDPSLYYDPAAGKDPYCCETEWDEICNGECMFVCGYSCPPGEPPVLPPTFGYVYHWSKAEGKDPLAAPLKVVPLQAGLVYVLDAVKCNVVLYRVFLPTL
jgi:hypothetical protein